jgi:hypothetical protein
MFTKNIDDDDSAAGCSHAAKQLGYVHIPLDIQWISIGYPLDIQMDIHWIFKWISNGYSNGYPMDIQMDIQ